MPSLEELFFFFRRSEPDDGLVGRAGGALFKAALALPAFPVGRAIVVVVVVVVVDVVVGLVRRDLCVGVRG